MPRKNHKHKNKIQIRVPKHNKKVLKKWSKKFTVIEIKSPLYRGPLYLNRTVFGVQRN